MTLEVSSTPSWCNSNASASASICCAVAATLKHKLAVANCRGGRCRPPTLQQTRNARRAVEAMLGYKTQRAAPCCGAARRCRRCWRKAGRPALCDDPMAIISLLQCYIDNTHYANDTFRKHFAYGSQKLSICEPYANCMRTICEPCAKRFRKIVRTLCEPDAKKQNNFAKFLRRACEVLRTGCEHDCAGPSQLAGRCKQLAACVVRHPVSL
jgi:hypothetical protein